MTTHPLYRKSSPDNAYFSASCRATPTFPLPASQLSLTGKTFPDDGEKINLMIARLE